CHANPKRETRSGCKGHKTARRLNVSSRACGETGARVVEQRSSVHGLFAKEREAESGCRNDKTARRLNSSSRGCRETGTRGVEHGRSIHGPFTKDAAANRGYQISAVS